MWAIASLKGYAQTPFEREQSERAIQSCLGLAYGQGAAAALAHSVPPLPLICTTIPASYFLSGHPALL